MTFPRESLWLSRFCSNFGRWIINCPQVGIGGRGSFWVVAVRVKPVLVPNGCGPKSKGRDHLTKVARGGWPLLRKPWIRHAM